jgi:dTMP kinase
MVKLITFEGIEGCGKTTQIRLLGDYLRKKGYTVYETREPGGTFIGDQIRKILLNPKNKGMDAIAELLLYEACRAQLIKELRVKSEELRVKGKDKEIILCDRFTDSTLVYQGYGRGIKFEIIAELNRIASMGIRPTLTILLDLDVKTGLKRARERNKIVESRESEVGSQGSEDRFEEEALEFHQKVREGYLEIASKETERVKIIDATKEIEEIHKEVVEIVEAKLIDRECAD